MFDPHVVKMPLETAQLLYSVWWVNNGSIPPTDLAPYKYMSKAYGSEDEKMKKKASNKRLELEDRPDLVKVYNKCKREYIKCYCIF